MVSVQLGAVDWPRYSMFERRRYSRFSVKYNCDGRKISGAGGQCQWGTANAATATADWPWQVAGEMLKWMTDGKTLKPVIPTPSVKTA